MFIHYLDEGQEVLKETSSVTIDAARKVVFSEKNKSTATPALLIRIDDLISISDTCPDISGTYTVQAYNTPFVGRFKVRKGWFWASNNQGDKIILPDDQVSVGERVYIDSLEHIETVNDEVYGPFKYYKRHEDNS